MTSQHDVSRGWIRPGHLGQTVKQGVSTNSVMWYAASEDLHNSVACSDVYVYVCDGVVCFVLRVCHDKDGFAEIVW